MVYHKLTNFSLHCIVRSREIPVLFTHIDLQVIKAPMLAQPQSLGLQATDWGILA